jgi:AraC-like DNA-binding protein
MGLVQVGPACVLQLSTSDKRNQNLDWYTPENMRGERLQMTAWHNSNEMMRGKGEFFHLEDRESNHPFIEKVWRCHTDRADTFLSVAANSFEMVVTRMRGKSFLTLRGPETAVTPVDCPAEGKWIGIRFKPGTLMPRFLPGSLRDHNDVTLPPAAGQSFWLDGSALEYPSFDNVESLVKRLAKSGMLSRDPIVEDTMLRRPRELSLRSAQRHFLRSTGVTYATFRQIERARYATILLRDGAPILDVVSRLGYFDQAHLTRSLRRFIGEAPAKIMERQRQLSFLYKTESPPIADSHS